MCTRLIAILAALACGAKAAAETPSADVWSHLAATAGDAPTLLGSGVISTGDDESHPTPTPDGRTLFYLKNTPSFDLWTIVQTELRQGAWSRPETVSFSGQFADADLVFTADGRRAYFVSKRPVNGKARTDTEIWTIDRTLDGRWGEPRHVAELSSPGDEWFPNLTADGTIYFGSTRPGGLGGCDIWRARLVNGVVQPPENLGAPINSKGEEIEAFVTPDERLLVIAARNRGDEVGAYDLYVSRRRGDVWETPRNLGTRVNSYAWEFSPRLSPDGTLLLFTSNRGFGSEPLERPLTFDELERRVRGPGNGLRDIYVIRTDQLW
jgi:Tol biopolymer transport system component